jgi:hypothetical protein
MAKIFDFSGLACLDFYKVRERLAVGQVSNMFTILETPDADPLHHPAMTRRRALSSPGGNKGAGRLE